MKKQNNLRIVLFFVSIFLLLQTAYAQKEVDSLLAKSNVLIYENPDGAIILAQQAYDYPDISIKNKVNALLTISTAYSSKRDYNKASEYVERIKSLIPDIKNERQQMNILNRIAGHYQELQIYDKAIDYLDQSLLLIEKYPAQDSVQTFLGYNATLRGFIYREQMNCEIALKYFDKAIKAYEKATEPHLRNANLSICYYNKGNCLLTLNKIEEAKTSFLNSIEYAQNAEAKSLIAFGQKGLAEAKTLEGKYNEAITLLNNARQTSENVGDLILNKGLYDGLANNYLALHDWENYTVFHNKFLSLQKQTKKAERKSVNQSLINLTESKAEEIDSLHKFYSPIQIFLIIFIIIALGMIIRLLISEEKKLKNLQEKLKN
jgi:tetratricopeptide (TPR) repeat protein